MCDKKLQNHVLNSPAQGPNFFISGCTSVGKKYGIKYEDISSRTLHRESIRKQSKTNNPTSANTGPDNAPIIFAALLYVKKLNKYDNQQTMIFVYAFRNWNALDILLTDDVRHIGMAGQRVLNTILHSFK